MNKKITGAELKSAFYMEPERVAEYFHRKELKVSYDWRDVMGEAHAKAFTVAKMTELDLLKDTKKILEESIKNGGTYEEFKKDAMALFEKKGWTGFKEVTNPKTGEKETVELGTPRRLKIIYTNNINSAYAAGKYRELLEEADVAPYWIYNCMMDGRERPEHAALHGKIYRCDDPFWNSFFPPNGWGCRCWVTNLTKRGVERKGLTVDETSENEITTVKDGAGVEMPVYKFENAGKFYTLKPDAGWGTNPAKYAWGIDVTAWNKVKDFPDDIKFKFISEMAENPYRKEVFTSFLDKALNMKPHGKEIVLTWLLPEIYKEVRTVQTPIIVMQDNKVGHIFGWTKTAKQKITKQQLYEIYDIINKPDEIYLDTTEDCLLYIRYLAKDEIIENRDVIKVAVKLNRINKGRPVNYLATVGRVNRKDNLNDNKRFKKLG